MDKKSITEENLAAELLRAKESGQLSEKYYQIAIGSIQSFRSALDSANLPFEKAEKILKEFFQYTMEQVRAPHSFEPYHKKIRTPIDYYKFSLDFFRILINLKESKLFGAEQLDIMTEQLQKGENVVFLANHQIEGDPQAIALMLEKTHPKLAEQIIYVAGERVLTDPLAIPFSLGTDLLCIYSKRYIDHPPEEKANKQIHNKNTMELMSRLLQEGGKAIYVAMSGGRDRKNSDGVIIPAPFDPNSIEMFYLMAKKAKTPTHFYPLALDTYHVMPPPETIQIDLGEARNTHYSPVRIGFGPECDMEMPPVESKEERRKARADKIWKSVCNLYTKICNA
jgi:glycerol-3-phosphate O-acyltransferase